MKKFHENYLAYLLNKQQLLQQEVQKLSIEITGKDNLLNDYRKLCPQIRKVLEPDPYGECPTCGRREPGGW